MAGSMLDSVRYIGDLCVASEHSHTFVEAIEQIWIAAELETLI